MSNRTTKKTQPMTKKTYTRANLSFFTTSAIKLMETTSVITNTSEYNNTLFIKNITQIREDILLSDDIKYEIKEIVIDINKLNELTNDTFVSRKLRFDNLNYEVSVSWKNNVLYFKTTVEKFRKIQKRLPIFIKMMNYIQLQSQQQKPITIYYVLSDLKKKLENNINIAPHHINSGYTDVITNEIFIWREEEFEKVTFHELIHLFNQDHRNEKISLPVKIKGPKSFYEAVTDYKAIIYNIAYISVNTRIKIETIIKNELLFIHNQAVLVMNHLKHTNCTQKTPAYSYFILKQHIFTYFTSVDADETLFNDIFYTGTRYNDLILLIKNYKLKETDFTNHMSSRMTLYELE